MATQIVKSNRLELLTNLYLTHTESQILAMYESGDFYELMGLKRRKLSYKTFERDLIEAAEYLSKTQSLSKEIFILNHEKWKIKLDKLIIRCEESNQLGALMGFVNRRMALDGVTPDGIQQSSGNTYIFQQNILVQNQPEKIQQAEIELAEWIEENNEDDN